MDLDGGDLMEKKQTCNNFFEFIKIAEANAKAANEGHEPSWVNQFWFPASKQNWVGGMVQAAFLGLYKRQLFSATGSGESTKFYMTAANSPYKFLFRIRSATFELSAAFLIWHVINALCNFRSNFVDHIGYGVSLAISIFYGLRLLRMLHLGSLAKCMPLHMHAFGYWAYPLIRGLTLFMVVFSGWYAVLFWYRMTGQLEYATYEVHWLMLPDSLNPKALLGYAIFTGMYLGGLWAAGRGLLGEVSNSQNIINKYGLRALFNNDAMIDPHRVADIGKLYAFVFALTLTVCGAYIPMMSDWEQ